MMNAERGVSQQLDDEVAGAEQNRGRRVITDVSTRSGSVPQICRRRRS